jgi:acetyl esterase/lipase
MTTSRSAGWSRWGGRLRFLLKALFAVLVIAGGTVGIGWWYLHPDYSRTDGVVYGRRKDRDLTMDVLRPAKPNGAGVAVMVSGSWKSGPPGQMKAWMLAPLLRRGFTIFAISHVSQPEVTVMEIIEDVNRGIRHVRHHADDYGIDPNRMGVTGGSSGGHLSLMLATRGGFGAPSSEDAVDRESSAVQAAALFFPVTDLLNLGQSTENLGDGGPPKSYVRAFGPDATNMVAWKEIGRETSPIYHVTSNMPPVLIHHGDADTLTPLEQTEWFAARALDVGAKVQVVVRPGKAHGWLTMIWDIRQFAVWFERHLNHGDRAGFRSNSDGIGFVKTVDSVGSRTKEVKGKTSRDELLTYLDIEGVVRPVEHVSDWWIRRAQVIRAMERIMGEFPGSALTQAKRREVVWEIIEDIDAGDHRRQSIEFESLPGAMVPAFLLIPKGLPPTGGWPAVLALHQTHPEGRRVVVGLGSSPDDEYGVELVRRGYVVIAPPYPWLADYEPDLEGFGFVSGTMRAIWDNVRAMDLLDSLPNVRGGRYGAIGHSLGGHNGLYTAVFDERLAAVVTSCGFDSYRDYYDGDPGVWQSGRGWCSSRYMPRLSEYQGRLEEIPVDFPEILGAIAPRAVWVHAPKGDDNFRWRSVEQVVKRARPVYELHGVNDNLMVSHPEDAHRFPPEARTAAFAFLDRHLR